MNNLFRLTQIISLALLLSFATSLSFASTGNDKAIEKARTAVKNAAPDDYQTLMKSAKILIRKNSNLDEALIWIQKSISINKNVGNLELLGDCYFKTGNNRQAMIAFVEAIKLGDLNSAHFNSAPIEEKIAKARK